MSERPTVPCRWCSAPTAMLNTKECDRCWELRRRVWADPELAKRMLEEEAKP